ncbi:zinc-binding alcohol dehydrogenase family protein [Streptomyces sp. NPDC059740]|uniref:quinone oxidoreductase family protein n=1 Tax=Streptomyces sp. NPDC059740 TaxID=3346926 RepID=UPI00365241F2
MRRISHRPSGTPGDPAAGLYVEEVAVPRPAADELLIRVEAVGVSLPMVRRTWGPRPVPALGGETAGEVVALGADVTGYRVGERVTGVVFGSAYAEYALLHRAMASRVPAGASAVDAVALVRGGVVALGALESAAPRRGESALLTAAAAGVGHLALQLARSRGLSRVVAAVSDPAKAGFLRGLGADEVVVYGSGEETDPAATDWRGPHGVVLDGVGGELLTPLVGALGPGGRLVAYSSGGGTIAGADLLAGGRAAIGFQIARIALEEPERYAGWRAELWRRFAAGELRAVVHEEVPLAEAARAHRLVTDRVNRGRVVLVP